MTLEIEQVIVCTDGDLTVFYTISGTATNGVDYRRLPITVAICSGAPSIAILLRPMDDTISDPDENGHSNTRPDPNYIIGSRNTATVTIHSND